MEPTTRTRIKELVTRYPVVSAITLGLAFVAALLDSSVRDALVAFITDYLENP